MNQEEFLIQHLTEGKSYKEIADTYAIDRTVLTNWWNTGIDLRNQIKKANQLYHSKKNKEQFSGFENITQREFFEWYRNHPRVCAYCGIEEYKLLQLFDSENRVLLTKRGRGRMLELERVDASGNLYSKGNCVLACYLCNNHKSDLINADDHKVYFAPAIRRYLDDKYNELKSRGH